MTAPRLTDERLHKIAEEELDRWTNTDCSTLHDAFIAAMHRALSEHAKGDVSADLRDALRQLVDVIEAAGLHNLTRGVQLGPTVWYVKASERIEYAKTVLSAAESAAPPRGEGKCFECGGNLTVICLACNPEIAKPLSPDTGDAAPPPEGQEDGWIKS